LPATSGGLRNSAAAPPCTGGRRAARAQVEGFARAYLGGALQERGALFNTRWQLNADWNLTGQCQWLWRQEDARALRGDRQCTAGLQRYF
jgi:hypothetical protein